jgi:hypothetical protein
MEQMMFPTRLSLLILLCAAPLACHSNIDPPASQPAPSQPVLQQFESKSAGIGFSFPAGWKQNRLSDTQVRLEAPGPAKISITLDVPKLPWHPFGIIPIGSVRDGYVEDQQKRLTDAKVTNLPDPTVPDASQRRVKISGHENGAAMVDDAALIVHADRVYILSLDCADPDYTAAKSALDTAVQTLHWVTH